MSKHGIELAKLAEINKVNLEFEAAVCGGVPVVRSLKEGLIANSIEKIYGILNGTSNFILTSMEKNNIVSTREPKSEDVNGAMYHFLFLSLSKTWTSKSCATKNAIPDPIAILIEIRSLKFVEKNSVNDIPSKNPI